MSDISSLDSPSSSETTNLGPVVSTPRRLYTHAGHAASVALAALKTPFRQVERQNRLQEEQIKNLLAGDESYEEEKSINSDAEVSEEEYIEGVEAFEEDKESEEEEQNLPQESEDEYIVKGEEDEEREEKDPEHPEDEEEEDGTMPEINPLPLTPKKKKKLVSKKK